ncbi:MAG: TetR/AcrR family transcriptional regulator [Deltaproteobacteria bacterium]|nr:TetR/AcrR family transcriptional regulator [Deltaproteobacteria bacterium]MBI3389935.1 TetR/AcrR family transcriptional regulator [Deltaproteobacteria bacterium]
MARTIPADRFQQLIDCATQVFIEQGYARTQMADVANAMGIAKGTLYLYVESKDALFDLVVRSADAEHPIATPPTLPVRTPKPGRTVQHVRTRLAEQAPVPALVAALVRQRVANPRAELTQIIREIYGTISRNRRGIKLMDRSAQFHPELASLWFAGARGALIEGLSNYLGNRIRKKLFRPVPDVAVAARVIMETIVTWAVHRHWDPSPQVIDDQVAEDTVVQFIVGGLMKEARS